MITIFLGRKSDKKKILKVSKFKINGQLVTHSNKKDFHSKKKRQV